MEILIKGAQLILSLSILVVLHELGHFLPARYFGTRVEKFYLFFDPWFSLWKTKWKGTEFGIGWIPFGGYVKISGMIDESMDKEQLAKPAEPWEFRSKPAWQRLIIMVGGVTVNLLLGMLIYIGILWAWGRDHLPLDQVRYGVHPSEVMKAEGVQEGDRIVAIDGYTPKALEEVAKAILIDEARTLTVERNGQRQDIILSPAVNDSILARNEKQLFAIRLPFYIGAMDPALPAAKSGLQVGDRLLAVNGEPTPFFEDFRRVIGTEAGKEVTLRALRGADTVSVPLVVDATGVIGVRPMGLDSLQVRGHGFQLSHEDYGFFAAVPAGIRYGVETLGGYVRSLKLLTSRTGASQIGGFGAIGGLFSPTWDWQVFWNMTAFLSIILAFMNILPIPALDGGHVVFLLYEIIARRPPNQRVMEVAQMVGMLLLLSLLLFANGNDLFKAIMN